MKEEILVNQTLKGIGVSSGITMGRVRLIDRDKVAITKRSISPGQMDREVGRIKSAVQGAIDELSHIKDSIPDDDVRKHAFIIDAHILILQDPFFVNSVIDVIRSELINAEWALDVVVSRFLASFDKVEDPYLRERGQDIRYIYERLARILVVGKKPRISAATVKGKSIIIARDLSPADTIQLNLNRISGFATDVGGRTSHTSIVARALEIPAVVGVGNVTSLVRNNDLVIIDGDEGVVIINPVKDVQKEYIAKQIHLRNQKKEHLRVARLKAETKDGFRLRVGANIELLAEMEIVEKYGAVGIGLYRTEYIYLSRKHDLPTEMDHYHIYRKLAQSKTLQYITIRTLDIGGDKFVSEIEMPKEINPAMGLRAIRLCIKEVPLFKAQLKGILRASEYGPLRILIPMVSGIEEVRKAKAIIAECMEELSRKKIAYNRDIKTGIMIEVPSACMISDMLAAEVDFFSIGTNDLIQYALAIDRVNEYVSYLYEPLHPAVLKMIKKAVDDAHAHKITIALCGEMAGEPRYVPVLLGLGLDEISMNPYSIPRAKKAIRGLDHGYCRELLEEIMKKDSPAEAELLLKNEMARLFPGDFPKVRG
ncbi:MAG: Phosphoenolpyruvate-protein phosphotransferase [Syntrophorhabdus sp. PtaB.Bin047]|nr:MAG: Phosphoenolpyruvate-protein phosphotransferase [Syntrophorhabdus sp. PtaB.Bin047]